MRSHFIFSPPRKPLPKRGFARLEGEGLEHCLHPFSIDFSLSPIDNRFISLIITVCYWRCRSNYLQHPRKTPRCCARCFRKTPPVILFHGMHSRTSASTSINCITHCMKRFVAVSTCPPNLPFVPLPRLFTPTKPTRILCIGSANVVPLN